MKREYLDLREGDNLRIGDYRLRVKSISKDGSAQLEIGERHYTFRRCKFVFLDGNTRIYNFGNRHHGRIAHIRIEMENRCRYCHTKKGRV